MSSSILRSPATSSLYPFSLHDALPICGRSVGRPTRWRPPGAGCGTCDASGESHGGHSCSLPPCGGGLGWGVGADHFTATGDRKSTRLNSSHVAIPYAVFCVDKKKTILS